MELIFIFGKPIILIPGKGEILFLLKKAVRLHLNVFTAHISSEIPYIDGGAAHLKFKCVFIWERALRTTREPIHNRSPNAATK